MAPSPRKRAPTSALSATWTDSDATTFDPAALPVSRLPRAWERRPKVTRRDGKEKKVWRTYATRSSTGSAGAIDEEKDSRVRAVKRQQRVRPTEMETMSATPRSKKRAFRATAFDNRRRSVLPRKMVTRSSLGGMPLDSVATESRVQVREDAESESEDSAAEQPKVAQEEEALEAVAVAAGKRRSSRFSFNPRETHSKADAMEVKFGDTSVRRVDEGCVAEGSEALDPAPDSIEVSEEQATNSDSSREGSPDEDFTEASMQLELLEELPAMRDSREQTPEDVVQSIEAPDVVIENEDARADQREVSQSPTEDAMDWTEDSPGPAADDPQIKSEPCSDDIITTTLDITDGLSLAPAVPVLAPSPGRKLLFPSPSPPPPERVAEESGKNELEATTTVFLDDDTALLKDFLTRAAASKASKTATIARRTSLQNRRDSDVIRQALASPTKMVLQDKDPNSPSRFDADTTLDVTLDLSQSVTLPTSPLPANAEAETGVSNTHEEDQEDALEANEAGTAPNSRRSTRARKSRLPAPGIPAAPTSKPGPNRISVRRADGGEPIVLKRTEAQELGLLTRANTRKNKQGAVNVQLRLMRLATFEAASPPADTQSSGENGMEDPIPGKAKRRVRWDTQLAYYQEDTRSIENAIAEAASLATPDELSGGPTTNTTAPKPKKKAAISAPATPKEKKDKSKDKVRKVRNLGATNGTPGKGLLTPASLLPDDVITEQKTEKDKKPTKPAQEKNDVPQTQPQAPAQAQAQAQAQRLPKPKPKATKLKLPSAVPSPATVKKTPIPLPDPSSRIAPTATKDRKSRLATPRKVKLPGLSPAPAPGAAAPDGKENRTGLAAGAAVGTGVGATPKKGLRLPEVVVPAMAPGTGGEKALPRRRGVRRAP